MGVFRALHVPVPRDGRSGRLLLGTLDALGQVPFRPPSVGGWPGGIAWLSTAATKERLHVRRRDGSEGRPRPGRPEHGPARGGRAPARRRRLDRPHPGRAQGRGRRPRPAGHPRPGQPRIPGPVRRPADRPDPMTSPVPKDGSGGHVDPTQVPARLRRDRGGRAGRRRRHGRLAEYRRPGPGRPAAGRRERPRPGHPVRRQRRPRHRHPVRGRRLPRRPPRPGVRRGRGARARRPARPQPGAEGPQVALGREAAGDRARRRLPEARPQPLPFDGHLAERLARPSGRHRLDRPLAGRDRAGPAAGGLGRRHPAAAGRGHEGGRRGAAADRVRRADRPDRRRGDAARRGRPGRPAEPGDGGPGHRHAAVRHRHVRPAAGRRERVVPRPGR